MRGSIKRLCPSIASESRLVALTEGAGKTDKLTAAVFGMEEGWGGVEDDLVSSKEEVRGGGGGGGGGGREGSVGEGRERAVFGCCTMMWTSVGRGCMEELNLSSLGVVST